MATIIVITFYLLPSPHIFNIDVQPEVFGFFSHLIPSIATEKGGMLFSYFQPSSPPLNSRPNSKNCIQ